MKSLFLAPTLCLLIYWPAILRAGLPWCLGWSKNTPANTGDVGAVPEWRRSPEGGKATYCNILAWQATVPGVTKESDTNEQLKQQQQIYEQEELRLGNIL